MMICKAKNTLEAFDTLVLPVEEGKGLTVELPAFLADGAAKLAEGFSGKRSEVKAASVFADGQFYNLILIGLGVGSGILRNRFLAFAQAAKKCRELKGVKVAVLMENAPALTACQQAKEKACEAFLLANYDFNAYRTKPVISSVEEVTFVCADEDAMASAVAEASNCAEAVCKARDVVNHPAMAMTPEKLASEAREAGAKYGFSVKVLDKQAIQEHKMGAFWAVAKGSAHEPRLIVMEYHGDQSSEKKIGLVGKGLMFDSGGFNLKKSMTTMYTDMGGGGAVLGAMIAIAKSKLKANVYGVIPACQNILSRDAYLPGDVITAMNGKTIEVDNTDAEGRLVLADAITYAFRVCKVDCVFDAATLTGAASVALGKRTGAYMTNTKELGDKVAAASALACEKIWELPLDEELFPSLSSRIADIKNSVATSNMGGGTIAGGLFLQEFTDDKPWAHLDIASVAYDAGGLPYCAPGATGYGVSLFYEIVKEMQSK